MSVSSLSRRRKAEPDRVDRREQIQQRAIEIFERKGFVKSSLQDIADELGITREAIYYYFSNKKEILLSVILEPSRLMLFRAEEILASGESLDRKVELAIRSHLEHFTPAYLEVSVALREKTLLEDEDFAELRRQWKRYEAIWQRLLEDGQASGLFHAEMNPKITSYAILGMCNWLSRWYKPDGKVGIDEVVENFYRLCAHGLMSPPSKAKSATRAKRK